MFLEKLFFSADTNILRDKVVKIMETTDSGIFRTLFNIYDRALKLSYFRKKDISQIFERVLDTSLSRSSHRGCSKKSCSYKFAIFTGKYLCWNLFLIKLQAFMPATFLKRDSNTGFFSVNIGKF